MRYFVCFNEGDRVVISWGSTGASSSVREDPKAGAIGTR